MSYRGMTDAKRVASFIFWYESFKLLWMTSPRVRKGLPVRVAFLAGDGCDASFVEGCAALVGLEVGEAVGFDVDRTRIYRLRAGTFPSWCSWELGEVEQASFDKRQEFDVVFLDFCHGLHRDSTIPTIYRVMRNWVAERGVLGFGVSYGRENSDVMTRLARREAQVVVNFGKERARKLAESSARAATLRALEINLALNERAVRFASPLKFPGFLSVTYKEVTPMMYNALMVGTSITPETEAILAENVTKSVKVSDPPRMLRGLVTQLRDFPSAVLAKAFCLDVGTITAWKAHATRGTYASASP